MGRARNAVGHHALRLPRPPLILHKAPPLTNLPSRVQTGAQQQSRLEGRVEVPKGVVGGAEEEEKVGGEGEAPLARPGFSCRRFSCPIARGLCPSRAPSGGSPRTEASSGLYGAGP